MVGTSLPSTSLPKAAALTDALISPSSELVSRDTFSSLRRSLERELRAVTAVVPSEQPIRVDGYHLRNATIGLEAHDSPFRWSPWTARRPIGVECARACLSNARLTTLQASHDVIERLTRRANDGRSHSGSLAEWLSGLSIGGRAAVHAEAGVWATQLLTSLDWTKLTNPIIGGDVSFVLPSPGPIVLRGRIEVRALLGSPDNLSDLAGGFSASPPSVLFTMMFGRPRSSAQHEMGLAALATALDDRHGDVPARVVGWWPQCGRALVLPIDRGLLDRTCESVVAAVRAKCRSKAWVRKSGAGRGEAKKPTRRPAVRVPIDN